MKLEDLGFNEDLRQLANQNKWQDFTMGRIIMQHKDRYVVLTTEGEFEAEITGNLRFSTQNKEDLPAVGDWAALSVFDGDFSIIHHVLPRYSILKRQAVGVFGEVQVIAANIDFAFLVQAVDRDFNINRLQRYLTICNAGKVKPVIVLTKIDLIDEEKKQELISFLNQRIKDVPHVEISNISREGYNFILDFIEKGKTYCLLGSSGVGKSTLLNNLSGTELMKTDAISTSNKKGRHVTTHRELILLPNGGILIDNPGMREVGITDGDGALETTFDEIFDLAHHCKYSDCSHTNEVGCAVLKAVEAGTLDYKTLENFQRMQREVNYFSSTQAEKRKKDKDFGKMIKNYKKGRKKDE